MKVSLSLGAFEAKNRLSELLNLVAGGARGGDYAQGESGGALSRAEKRG